MMTIMIVGILVLIVGYQADAFVQTDDGKSDQIQSKHNFVQYNDDRWYLTGRQGTLAIDFSPSAELIVHMPKQGPSLIVPQGYEEFIHIEHNQVIHTIRKEDASSADRQSSMDMNASEEILELIFYAEMGVTMHPYVEKIRVQSTSDQEGISLFADDEERMVTLEGRGYGHRTGLSQNGMNGLTNRGVGYEDILQHYYPGTTLEKVSNDQDERVRVHLNNRRPREEWTFVPQTEGTELRHNDDVLATLSSGQSYTIKQQDGYLFIDPIPQGIEDLLAGDDTQIDFEWTSLTLINDDEHTIDVSFPHSTTRKYTGVLDLSILANSEGENQRILMSTDVRMDDYLKGVVPYEAFASWPLNSLKTQSVAARTFVTHENYSVFDSTRSQVYRGVYENALYSPVVNTAVEETDGQKVLHNGSVAISYYSSSNGGWRERNIDGPGGSTLFPYLEAAEDLYVLGDESIVPEEYSLGTPGNYRPHNLYHWTRNISVASIEALYPQIGTLLDISVVERTAGQGIRLVEIEGTTGKVERSGVGFRRDIGTNVLLSTYVSVQEIDPVDDPSSMSRIGGLTRFETAINISQEGWPSGADTVILARADDYADALAGATLAYEHDAPILLTSSGTLTVVTLTEIERLQAEKVFVLGGEEAIHPLVKQELENRGLIVQRIAGYTRFETAAEIARETFPDGSDNIVLVYSHDFPDAISAAPYAARNGYPILLTGKQNLPEITKKVTEELGAVNTFVIGGSSVIEDMAFVDLPGGVRLSGNDRYLTNLAVAEYFASASNEMYMATGADYADALTGAALAAKNDRGILLVGQQIPDTLQTFLGSRGINQFTILGGEAAVGKGVEDQLKEQHFIGSQSMVKKFNQQE